MLNVELEVKERELEAFKINLAARTLQLQASEGKLLKLTLTLEASDNRIADLTRKLQASEKELSQSILRLEISDGKLIDSTLEIRASEERQQADEDIKNSLISQLNKALAGKTVLMRELHHRVKNNLAVIAALLQMQAATLTDERAIKAFADSQQRVMSMALIHESLYGREDMDRLNFREYLEKLVRQLHAAYALENNLIRIKVAAEDIELPMHRVIYCGLIVNELVSNALKYSYPHGRGGEIHIKFARLESGSISLSCQDNGPGIPESFDWTNSPSLGLRIIRTLTNQMNGELKLDRSQGTKFELTLPWHSIPAAEPNDPSSMATPF
ncbi:sensor histidine kinase [Nevskia soli]|jgi:two-component sensor histidine kinase|uniref:sensor histidine kinase n=1 Tax=Nevskia soli TaxID=418856 RepID=UPI0015D7ED5C|nr:sensor histidine kinase [Nevskia soli]